MNKRSSTKLEINILKMDSYPKKGRKDKGRKDNREEEEKNTSKNPISSQT